MIKIVKDDVEFLLQKVRGRNNKNPKRLLHTELFLKHSAGFQGLCESVGAKSVQAFTRENKGR
jgi:hypothetical protein